MLRLRERRKTRTALLTIFFALLVATAGCAGSGDDSGDAATETTVEQVTEPPVETTAEPTDGPTEAPPETDEPTDAPPETEAPGGGEGGDDTGDTGDDESNNQTLLLLGALAVFAVGFVAAGVLRGRTKSESATSGTTTAAAATPEHQSDAERVISLLHKNNGRMFVDVLEEELDWSPARARRVLDGLVATGDVERRETDGGTLVVFADPTRTTEE